MDDRCLPRPPQEDLYDLLVDVGTREVTVASHAKDDFRMGELHREVAKFLVDGADGDGDDSLIKACPWK